MLNERSITERMRSFFRNSPKITDEIIIDPTTKKVERPTTRISRAELELFPIHHQSPFGLRMGAASTYRRIPSALGVEGTTSEIVWRIELHGLARNIDPQGFDILGDVVLGRNADRTNCVDIALDSYGAAEQGVSRNHAMLRPTRNCLYLLDLNSTNGTFYNAMRLGAGVVYAVKDDDTIILGSYAFEIRIIDCPSMH